MSTVITFHKMAIEAWLKGAERKERVKREDSRGLIVVKEFFHAIVLEVIKRKRKRRNVYTDNNLKLSCFKFYCPT
jgi:hypothetical protein